MVGKFKKVSGVWYQVHKTGWIPAGAVACCNCHLNGERGCMIPDSIPMECDNNRTLFFKKVLGPMVEN